MAFSSPSPSLIWRLGLPPSTELMQIGRVLRRGGFGAPLAAGPCPRSPGQETTNVLRKEADAAAVNR